MSQNQALAFLERMKSDEAFNEAVNRIKDVDKKMAYIERKGYRFTADELEEASFAISM